MSSFDPYTTLGLPKNADADAIKAAYRRLVREWHPDVNDDPQAVERTAELNVAYEILGDPKERADYDTGGFDLASFIEKWLHRQETCLRCGKDLLGRNRYGYRPRRDTLYCSNACRQAAYRARKKAAATESRNADTFGALLGHAVTALQNQAAPER